MDSPEPIVLVAASAPSAPVAPEAAAFVEPPDTGVLVERARDAVRNVPGCFNLKGDARDTYDAGLFGQGERHWLLEGQLLNGVWSPFTATVAADSPEKPDADEKRRSIFGRLADSESDADTGRQSILQALQDDVTMEYMERRESGWVLIRTLKGGKAGRNVLTLGFDAAFVPHEFGITIVDPVVVKGDRGRGKIVWMDVAVATNSQGAPLSERMDAKFAAWPFAVEVHTITNWVATSCG